jgi:hypothetical protein
MLVKLGADKKRITMEERELLENLEHASEVCVIRKKRERERDRERKKKKKRKREKGRIAMEER